MRLRWRSCLLWLLGLIVFLVLLLCIANVVIDRQMQPYVPPGKVGEIQREKRAFSHYGIKEGEYELGTFFVPENRSEPNCRAIPISFAHFKSATPKGPPVFILPGGPGNSFIAKNNELWLNKAPRYLAALLDGSDVVLVNQRGYNHRHHVLYGWYADRTKPDWPVEDRVAAAKASAASISEAIKDKADLRGYTVLELADDVNDLRKALGYDKIVLMGQSFGSQSTFAVMRRHPQIVERAIVSGVEPLNHTFDMASHVLAAAHRVWKSVEEDPEFAKYLPPGGMTEAAETVISRLETQPIKVVGKGMFGTEETTQILGPEDFPWRNPVAILELYHGQTKRWQKPRRNGPGYGTLIYSLMDSSLGVTADRKEELLNDPANRYVSPSEIMKMLATADIWPSPDVGDEFRRPVECDVPVLFVHGDWDMNTPIENTHEIAPYFPNAHILEITQGGHDPIPPMVEEHPDTFAAVMEFAHTGSKENLPDKIKFKPSKQYDPPTFPVATP